MKSNKGWLLLVALLGSLLPGVPASALFIRDSASNTLLKPPPPQLSNPQLHSKALSITVKVLSGEGWGSGILIKQQNSLYTVITNAHVLRGGNPPYRIQTSDGHIYTSTLLKNSQFKENDLAILQFRSPRAVYTVASFGKSSTVATGDEVFAAGFAPATKNSNSTANGFVLKTGKVSLKLDKALEGGYKLGYTNDIQKGMSGGPLLNRRGEVIGVNGKSAEPLWGVSVFYDGEFVASNLQHMIERLSWAVPIETVLQLVPASLKVETEPILYTSDWVALKANPYPQSYSSLSPSISFNTKMD